MSCITFAKFYFFGDAQICKNENIKGYQKNRVSKVVNERKIKSEICRFSQFVKIGVFIRNMQSEVMWFALGSIHVGRSPYADKSVLVIIFN